MYGGVVAARIEPGPPDGQQIYGKLEQRNEATAPIYCKAEMIWKILAKLRFDEIRTSVPCRRQRSEVRLRQRVSGASRRGRSLFGGRRSGLTDWVEGGVTLTVEYPKINSELI